MKFITQAAKVLQEQKKSKRRLAVFLCLAALVALGTVTALRMYGQAMSHKEKRLICQAEAHQHTDDCYDGDKLVCGQADYLVHTHNDDCYGADGSLVCHLAEIAVHTHTDECYTEEEVLVCTEEEQAHQHTDDCYTPERGDLQCQTEEHAHDEGCFDSETGELVCQLEEHQHDDNCYAWNEVLTCTAGGHQHSADCYIKEQGGLQCQIEEHTHDDACYDENGALICQMEEHTHEDTCYAWEDVLICQLEEGPAGHIHTDACYEKRKVPTCGQLELHTHGGSCYDENGELICELLELKEHTHQEECFETVELTDEEVAVKLEQQEMEEAFQEEDPENAPEDGTDSTSDDGAGTVSGDSVSNDEAGSVSGDSVSGDDVSGNSVSGDSVSGDSMSENDVHEHDETCYDAAGGLMCGYEDIGNDGKVKYITKSYKDEKYFITASYQKDANIPDEAELRIEEITSESDKEDYAKHEMEFRKNLNDENAAMRALFKIGFYVDEKEIEPETPVTVKMQFLDEEGLPEGAPITVVHFSEKGTEKLEGTEAEDDSTSFEINSFSYISVHVGEPESGKEKVENGIRTVGINEEYDFQTEKFVMRFSFIGRATVLDEAAISAQKEAEEEKNTLISPLLETENPNGEDTDDPSDLENPSEDFEEKPVTDEEVDDSGKTTEIGTETTLPEESGSEEDEPSDTAEPTVTDVPADSDASRKFEFTADLLEENSEEYKIGIAHAEETIQGEIFALEAVTYSLKYKGEELDLSDCKVTVEVVPTSTFSSYMASVAEEEIKETGIKAEESEIVNIAVVELDESQQQKEITSELHGKDPMVRFRSTSSTFVTVGSKTANPKYKVQYYATLDVIDKGAAVADSPADAKIDSNTWSGYFNNYKASITNDKLPFINTSGKKLPENGKVPDTITIPIVNNKVKTKREDTKVYETKDFEYILAPTLRYVNVLADNPGYTLKAIWVLKSGKDPESKNAGDWDSYVPKNGSFDYIHFTNRKETIESKPDKTFILIKDDTVIRMLYDVTPGTRNSGAIFYDYDISNGEHGTAKDSNKIMYTTEYGINSKTNCDSETTKYAFGNNNAGTKFGQNVWDISQLNMTNMKAGSFGYAGCTFGIANSPDGESLNFNPAAPKVFGEATQIGKKRMVGEQNKKFSLDFERKGDMYTLIGVKDTQAQNLNTFNHPTYNGTTHSHILTNNFWPMDGEKNADEHTGGEKTVYYNEDNEWKKFPPSDDGLEHNNYFGMYYTVDFDLDKSYTGPLEYLFYGDDDMWVFLDDTLVCDIGGVHSSVGEYVNLWDWIDRTKLCDHAECPRDETGKIRCDKNVRTLSFYYTERGASGSSCWMQFTLPSITTMTPETTGDDYGRLKIKKTVTVNNPSAEFNKDQDTFKFRIDLEGANDDYAYTKYDADGKEIGHNLVLWDGGSFTLKNGEYIIINNLPVGTKYTITEINEASSQYEESEEGTVTETLSEYEYFTDVTVNGSQQGDSGLKDDKTATGSIRPISSGKMDEVVYTNQYRVYELPKTGGSGDVAYIIVGIFCIMIGAVLVYRERDLARKP